MTIKELCENSKHCADCAFELACDYLNCTTPNNLDDHLINDAVTRSLIETAEKLKGMGKWINKKPRWIPSLSMTINDAYECSKCSEPGIKYWQHCIHCGSPMEVEK